VHEPGVRNLVVVLGDQLNRDSGAFDDFDPAQDRVWMAEVAGEANHVWSHKARIAIFLSAMRHFRETLLAEGVPIIYRQLGNHPFSNLSDALTADLFSLKPAAIIMARPGEFRLQEAIGRCANTHGVPLQLAPDRHFVMSTGDFARWASNRKTLRSEHLYRVLRRRTGILMSGTEPHGGRWNYDAENRQAFGRRGPPRVPPPAAFAPDAITREVLRDVETHFPSHPGSTADFDWPVTAAQAKSALTDFLEHRLTDFGRYQDALWTGNPYLFHARLSPALNLKLLSPLEVLGAAAQSLASDNAPLAAVEGFIRQILGWREFIRGVYWSQMPDYLDNNALEARHRLPGFYWTAETDMACLREVIEQTLRYGYAHHIQRLMVTGLFALLLGVEPRQVHEWFLAVYVDAVEWVEVPNTVGMSQYADGGLVASKPYVASGRYIQRMSNYCHACRFQPGESVGPTACPFTTLYWDFLIRHRMRFAHHPRTALQWRSLERFDEPTQAAIVRQAAQLRTQLA
jgi:deoxyribodipyrimidine photolyase-related protein